MCLIALEEAFFIPELAQRQLLPAEGLPQITILWNEQVANRFSTCLPDFADQRLREMDDTGIDLQVLSLTVPGMQIDIDAELACAKA